MENQFKEPVQEQPEQSQVAPKRRASWMGGRKADRYLRYVLFLVVIGLVYIANTHWAEKQVRREEKLKREINEAKAEYKTINARLSARTIRTEIQGKVSDMGLAPSSAPFKLKPTGDE